ncbi:unknown [Bacteroides sp. CAG:1060]|nr:unknown [Bacteroides sp. CAG:1060]
MLLVMKYESAALLTLIIANAVMKKNASTRSGLLRVNSCHRSLTFTLADSLASITTFSFVWEKQKMRSTRPRRANMVMVTNHADADSGVL